MAIFTKKKKKTTLLNVQQLQSYWRKYMQINTLENLCIKYLKTQKLHKGFSIQYRLLLNLSCKHDPNKSGINNYINYSLKLFLSTSGLNI